MTGQPDEKSNAIGDTLRCAGKQPVLLWPVFVEITGTVAGAILLSQIIYWWDRVGRPFYKSDEELRDETHLTERSLRTARDHLRTIPGVKIKRRGWPARVWYEIDQTAFLGQFSSLTKSAKHSAQFDEISQTGLTKSAKQSDENVGTIKEQTLPDITTDTTSLCKGKRRFVPPNLDDIRKWVSEHPRYGNVDPQAFYDYYQATGWTDARGKPVKSWTGKLITWSTHNGKQSRQGAHGGPANDRGIRGNPITRDTDPGREAEQDPDVIWTD